jgi:hypothetical protein
MPPQQGDGFHFVQPILRLACLAALELDGVALGEI